MFYRDSDLGDFFPVIVDERMVLHVHRDLGALQYLNLPTDKEDCTKQLSGTFQTTMDEDWESWAKVIKACVCLAKTPLTLYEINREVKMLQGRDIPYRQLNYGSLEDMINSISGLKVTQLNDTLTVMKATLASELVFRFLKHVQRTMQHRKRNCKKMGAAKILFSQPIIKYFILCVLAVGFFICFNILLFVFDAPSAFNVMKNDDQTFTGAYSKCPGLEAPPVPSIGSIFNIHVTQATDPDHFIVQPFNNIHELEALMNELSRFYENYSGPSVTLSSLKVGNMYAAKYDENGRWYRTCISKIISKTTGVVYFCDYGEYKVISLEQLRPLENNFYNLPYQAIKAKLHGITPKLKNGWTLKDSSRFNELIAAKNFVSLIKSYEVENSSTEEIIIGLELIDTSTLEGTYITKIFVSENRADRTE